MWRELTQGGEGCHLHHGRHPPGRGHGGGLDVHHGLHLLRHGQCLLGGYDGARPSRSVALVRGAANEEDWGGRRMVPQLRNPVVDGGEEGGGVGDAIAEEEDVRLPVGKGARGARSPQPTCVPHRVLHPPTGHHTLLLVAREGGGRVRLQQEVLLVEILAELPGSNLPK